MSYSQHIWQQDKKHFRADRIVCPSFFNSYDIFCQRLITKICYLTNFQPFKFLSANCVSFFETFIYRLSIYAKRFKTLWHNVCFKCLCLLKVRKGKKQKLLRRS